MSAQLGGVTSRKSLKTCGVETERVHGSYQVNGRGGFKTKTLESGNLKTEGIWGSSEGGGEGSGRSVTQHKRLANCLRGLKKTVLVGSWAALISQAQKKRGKDYEE